jgi:Uma2 family endonuclease
MSETRRKGYLMTRIATLSEPPVVEQRAIEQEIVEQEIIEPVNGARRFPRQGEWTYEDWLNFPNDGWKYEIIDGVLYMSPPPRINHQDILGELFSKMRTHAKRRRLGKVLCAPCGVRLPGQPVPVDADILFVRRPRLAMIGERYVNGAPDLIVEILSPSNASYDLETKFAQYERAGVEEYWVVIPWDKMVRVFRLVRGRYQLVGEYGSGQRARSSVLTGFTIDLNQLFELEMGNEDV